MIIPIKARLESANYETAVGLTKPCGHAASVEQN